MCISVKILSRSLEGKLIVCSCTSVGDGKVCLLPEYQTRLKHDKHTIALATTCIWINDMISWRLPSEILQSIEQIIYILSCIWSQYETLIIKWMWHNNCIAVNRSVTFHTCSFTMHKKKNDSFCVLPLQNSCWEDNLKLRTKGVARTLTVIFNPRMCSDIELEVGNLTCIRPPWYE